MEINSKPETIAAWIARHRDVARLSQQQFAAEIGKSRTTLSNWESGKRYPSGETMRPRAGDLRRIVEVLRRYQVPVTVADAYRVAGYPTQNLLADRSDSSPIPAAIATAAALGNVVSRSSGRVLGTVPAGIPEFHHGVGEADGDPLLQTYGGDFYLIARGDSMIPDVQEGDILIVRATHDAVMRSVVIALVNGESVCKRLTAAVPDENGDLIYTLTPSNDKYRAIHERDIQIQGIVVARLTPRAI